MENILEKINKATIKFLEPIDLNKTYETIVKEAIKLVNADYGSIFLEHEKELKRVYASSSVLYQTLIRKRGYTYNAYKQGKPSVLHLQKSKVKKIHKSIDNLNIRSTIFIPLSYKNKSIGVLSVDTLKDKYFAQKELNILKLFGSLATLAIIKMQLYDETKKALESRDIFISRAAHELRTPLTAMGGYIQLLHKKLALQNTKEYQWIDKVQKEGKRLALLIDELLEINRIRSGKSNYEFKESSLEKLIIDSVEDFKYIFPLRHIVLQNKLNRTQDTFIGDYYKLKQAFSNILENAAKYSSADTPIRVKLSVLSSYFSIEVSDKGVGIGTTDLLRIEKEDFHELNHKKESGMGWGLYLTYNIVKKHKGKIEIRTQVDKGTTITIKIPRIKS